MGIQTAVGLVLPCAVAAQELIDQGLELSRTLCTRCHSVSTDQPWQGIASTPSFNVLVNGLDDWEDRFGTFFERLPHQSVFVFAGDPVDPEAPPKTMEIEMEYDDVDAIVAYARSLLLE